jgi:hypothetical protein
MTKTVGLRLRNEPPITGAKSAQLRRFDAARRARQDKPKKGSQ